MIQSNNIFNAASSFIFHVRREGFWKAKVSADLANFSIFNSKFFAAFVVGCGGADQRKVMSLDPTSRRFSRPARCKLKATKSATSVVIESPYLLESSSFSCSDEKI